MAEIVGVILTAGKASRITPLNEYAPKSLLPIGNKELIRYQIDQMKSVGIERVIIVVGHLGQSIRDYLGDGAGLGVSVEYVEQKIPLGIANALGQTIGVVKNPFILYLGDIFTVTNDLQSMLDLASKRKAKAVLATMVEDDPELLQKNFSVETDGTGRVVKVNEKPRGELKTNLKGCGIYYFDPIIFEAVKLTPRTALRDEYELTNSIQILIDSGEHVCHASIIESDMNVTFPPDLLACNLNYLKTNRLDRIIGDNCNINKGCVIENSVIGNNVIIKNAIHIKDSLILSETVVDKQEDLVRFLATPSVRVKC